ncbi:regulatory signaling modulator protein AmpE [Isoalcanivorax beigongshangi]|uniref:Regulatory signaling modulator protein AmpE n=1 Tax=Isoalcanivorax beigongshangi TaxID=3238810 RepID=A0ABV4AL42_9GAMM
MRFIVLLVALALRRLDLDWPPLLREPQRQQRWMRNWNERIGGITQHGTLRWLGAVVMPVLAVALVMHLLQSILWGLPALLAGLLLLLWLIGVDSEHRHVEDLLARARMSDPQRLREQAEAVFAVVPQEQEDESSYGRRLVRDIWLQGTLTTMATLFWLVTLGYWAAALYVLNACYLRLSPAHQENAAGPLDIALRWLPSRLLVLAAALVSDFARVMDVARGRWWKLDDSERLLGDVFEAALPSTGPAAGLENQLAGLQALMQRTLAIWLILGGLWMVLAG